MINYLKTPFKWFFKLEAASGLLLLIFAVIALIFSNIAVIFIRVRRGVFLFKVLRFIRKTNSAAGDFF